MSARPATPALAIGAALALALAFGLAGSAAQAASARLCPIVIGPQGAEKQVTAVTGAVEGELTTSHYDLVGPYTGGKNAEAAEKAIRQARLEVERGRRKFAALELEDAAEHFERAVESFRTYASSVRDVDGVAQALSLLAATALLQGNDGVGTTHLADAIALRPDLEPDATAYNEDMRQVFTQTRDTLRKSRGTMSVEVTPPAAVFVDGIYRGVAPVTVSDLVEGQHLVRAVAPGLVPSGTTVAVSNGATEKVAMTLEAAGSAAELQMRIEALDPKAPDAAALRSLGKDLGADALLVLRLTPSGDTKATADATLYGVTIGAKLAESSKPVGLESAPKTLGDVRALLGILTPPALGVAINPVAGVGDKLKEEVEASAVAQLEKAGARVKALTEELKPKCLAEADCREKITAGLDAVGIVDLSGKEAGQKLKLKETLYSSLTGDAVLKKNKTIGIDEIGEGGWLDAELLLALTWESQTAAGGPTAVLTGRDASGPEVKKAEKPKEEVSEGGGAGTAGWIFAGLGLAAGVTGGALMGWQLPLRATAATPGTQKDDAQTISQAGFGLLVSGGTVFLVGLIMALAAD